MRKVMLQNAGNGETSPDTTILGPRNIIAAIGTFDGGSITINGSIDGGTTWKPLNYEGGGDVVLIEEIPDLVINYLPSQYMIQAVTSGGGGSMDVTVTLIT